MFRDGLAPLAERGQLGSILLQYPKWVFPSSENRAQIEDAVERLKGWTCAVEFRNGSWLNEKNAERTTRFLAERNIPFVMVDEPQGFKSSVPPEVLVTSSDLALVRFHGRNAETWEAKGITPAERFRYLYSRDELSEWVPRIREVAKEAKEVHLMFNNCYANYGTTNATGDRGPAGRRTGRLAPVRALAAAVPEEALDVGDQVVAGRQPLLIDHRLEPLYVGPRRLLEGGGRVEARVELLRLVAQRRDRDLGPEMAPDGAEQLHRGGGIRPGDVVGDLGVVADGRDARLADRMLEDGDRRGRNAQHPCRPRLDVAEEQARLGRRPEDVRRARVGHGSGDRPEADPEPDAELFGDLDDRCRELPPPEIRLGAGQDEQVATVDSGSPNRQARPGQFRQPAVHDLERRPARSVVEEEVAIELDDDLAAVGQLPGGSRRSAACIDPAVEGGDEGRRDEVGGLIEAIERHLERIGPGSEPVDDDRLRWE